MTPITYIPYEPLRGYRVGELPSGGMSTADMPMYGWWMEIYNSLKRNDIQ